MSGWLFGRGSDAYDELFRDYGETLRPTTFYTAAGSICDAYSMARHFADLFPYASS